MREGRRRRIARKSDGPLTYSYASDTNAADDPHHTASSATTYSDDSTAAAEDSYSYDASYDVEEAETGASAPGALAAQASARTEKPHAGSIPTLGRASAPASVPTAVDAPVAVPAPVAGDGGMPVQLIAMGAGLLCACILYPICALPTHPHDRRACRVTRVGSMQLHPATMPCPHPSRMLSQLASLMHPPLPSPPPQRTAIRALRMNNYAPRTVM